MTLIFYVFTTKFKIEIISCINHLYLKNHKCLSICFLGLNSTYCFPLLDSPYFQREFPTLGQEGANKREASGEGDQNVNPQGTAPQQSGTLKTVVLLEF